MGENLSPADIKAVVGENNNGFAYGYPVMPMYGGFGGNNGFGNSSDWLWIILLLALFGGFGNNGNGGGFGNGFNNDYAWLSNGQKEIMQNTNDGFNTLHLSNQIEGVRDGIYGLSNQLCNCCADMNQTVSSGFANAETSANARQMANMQQNFNNQIATLQGFNGVTQGFNQLGSQMSSCCCDIREGIAGVNYNNAIQTNQLQAQIASENCADRAAISDGIRDIITNQTSNTQRILDQLCADKIDAKNEKIADLERQLQMADLRASQIAQTAQIREGQIAEVDALYDRLSNCPVPTTPVYGRTPIFTCNNNNGGCGCGNTFGNTLV